MILLFVVFLQLLVISLYFLKKKVGKILFIVSILAILLLFLTFFWHDIIFFFESLEYQKIYNYDYSNDINQYGYITEYGAIKIALESAKLKRMSKVKCQLNEQKLTLPEFFYDTTNQERYNRIKNCTKYYNISFVIGWDRGCEHEEVSYFTIDYYTGEIFLSMATM